jgi:GNAT superfamily N-acetyltransferase
MNFYIKSLGADKAEAWIEVWGRDDWEVVCEAFLLLTPDQILIDNIETKLPHRNRGYATALIERLKKTGKIVAPIGIKPSATGFWEKLGMSDALGQET